MQINIRNAATNATIEEGVTKPLFRSLEIVYPFTMACISLLALVIAFRIFKQWQEGGQEITAQISKWFFGLILVLFLAFALQQYADGILNNSPNFIK